MARHVFVQLEDGEYERLARVAKLLGLSGVNQLLRMLAKAEVMHAGALRYAVVIGPRKKLYDVIPWKRYSELARELARAKAENAELKRALAYLTYGSPRARSYATRDMRIHPTPEEAAEAWREACREYARALATHGLLSLAKNYITRRDNAIEHYLEGRRAWFLLGACQDYILNTELRDKSRPTRLVLD